MVVAAVACAVGLAVVAWSLYRDDPLPPPTGRCTPEWGPLPEPADLLRLDLPRSVTGYDPASVDAHLDALIVAYRDLLAEAPPEVVARARRRAAARQGFALPPAGDPAEEDAEAGDGGAEETARPADGGSYLHSDEDPREALRAEAALASLRAEEQRRP